MPRWQRRLTGNEREYMRGLKRKDREQVARVLAPTEAPSVPLRIRVLQSGLPTQVKLSTFETLRFTCSDKLVAWAERAVELPLGCLRQPFVGRDVKLVLTHAKTHLDAVITGHANAKHEVLKLVCQSALNPLAASTYAVGLEGPPGCGKTQFVQYALAPALCRPFVSIPLGGANDLSYLLGHSYTYEGSKEGRLAAGLIASRCTNPVFYFDEVDKISRTERGTEIVNCLVHLIDPTANHALRDRYFHDIDLDFSRCTFVFSYNDASKVDPILLDRIKRVAMAPPTRGEKQDIVLRHIIPRAQRRLGTGLTLAAEAVDALVSESESKGETGMRNVEKRVEHVLASAQMRSVIECEDEPPAAIGASAARAFLHDLCAAPGRCEEPPSGMYT